MRIFAKLLMLSSLVWALGCGTSAVSTPDPAQSQTATSSGELKKRLQEVAASGISGSGLAGIKESIDQTVRPTNSKLADQLTNDFNALAQTTESAAIKEIATRMANRL